MSRPEPDKAESDVERDTHVAHSRRGRDADGSDADGSHVGQASPDDDFDSGETGAEARSTDK
ncbi:hypothetical protein FR943_16005 [Mycobacterium sp. TNTM28]|uniref:Uncharacterized protein n=1 Tax=[Mycobacterium] fortunisiensis TaxID=2600579 RepID=A0ABS6KP03_9MYCO|nr:hypothetical protein [[Mycobacterium] fortunisiensis]MBU9765344.1 hypothetical protein [[Mycobacterium] fortunisiensis]